MNITRVLPSLVLAAPFLLSGCGSDAGNTVEVRQSSAARASVAANPSTVFTGLRDEYTITKEGSGYLVSERMPVPGYPTINLTVAVPADARLKFSDTSIAFDLDSVAGKAFRAYRAAFARMPDAAGLGYWISVMDKGASLDAVAAEFVNSAEFKSLYGAEPSNAEIVDRLYQNVLDRKGDPGGVAFWNSLLDKKQATVAQLLLYFSESPENRAAVQATIARGIAFEEPGLKYAPVATAMGLSYAARPYSSTSSAALISYNAQGAKGYAFVGPLGSPMGNWHVELYAKGEPGTTYAYEVVPASGLSAAARLAAMEELGAKGYLFKSTMLYPAGSTGPHDVFVKSSKRRTVYSYQMTVAQFSLDEAIAKGALGYAHRRVLLDNNMVNLYVNDGMARATIEYAVRFPTSFDTGLLVSLNKMGAQSFGYAGSVWFGSGMSSFYARSTTSWAPLSYTVEASPALGESEQEALDALNAHAAKGEAYYGDYGTQAIFYRGGWVVNPQLGPVFP